jgi:redox-sensitive bicupin YhaK (pirin superfamily)
MIDGVFQHQDSNGGGGGFITDGDTHWMTAGGGILHIEAPPEEVVVRGGLFHGFQLWVNLPARLKMTPPRYQDIRGGAVKLLSSPDGGALVRVIAGEVAGHSGPGVTYTPISLLHATLAPGAELRLPWRADFNALVYVLAGSGTAGTRRQPVRTGQLAAYGPFVMNTRAELIQAFEDYQAGRLGTIPAEPHPGHQVPGDTAGEPRT